MLTPFEYESRTRLVFGVNSIERVASLARELGATKVLVVTDPGLVKAGHVGRMLRLLEQGGLSSTCFDQVQENPSTRDVGDCLQIARSSRVDLLIGLGGGSAIDTAKGCNFLLTNGGEIQDYWGVGKATRPMLPLIAVPTTAGTGSECQSAALISDERTHQKMACLDPKAAPRIALLDPSLTLSQPEHVTAQTGLDAIAHALESAVCTRRNVISLMFSQESLNLTINSLSQVLRDPRNMELRARMLLGAAFAGTAVEMSMLGAAHAAANPLTACYGIPHGQAVALMLPLVIQFNAQAPQVLHNYGRVAGKLGIAPGQKPDRQLSALVELLTSLLVDARVPSLHQLGVREAQISELAAQAAQQWTARFNPRPVVAADFAALYRAALNPAG